MFTPVFQIQNEENDIAIGMIVGIIIGVIAVVAAVVLIVIFVVRRPRKLQFDDMAGDDGSTPTSNQNNSGLDGLSGFSGEEAGQDEVSGSNQSQTPPADDEMEMDDLEW